MCEDLDFSGAPDSAQPSKIAGLLTRRELRRNMAVDRCSTYAPAWCRRITPNEPRRGWPHLLKINARRFEQPLPLFLLAAGEIRALSRKFRVRGVFSELELAERQPRPSQGPS